jgi:hypothetical protein
MIVRETAVFWVATPPALACCSQARRRMSATPLDLFFAWAALLSAAATLGTFATSILFFAVDRAFGRINDALAVAMALPTVPAYGALGWLELAVGGRSMPWLRTPSKPIHEWKPPVWFSGR